MDKNMAAGAVVVAAAALGLWVSSMPSMAGQSTVEPDVKTADVLSRIRGYQRWQLFPEFKAPMKSDAHWDLWVVAYHNEAASRAREGGSFPEGSLLVKENRPAPNAAPTSISTMAKVNGAWFWIQTTPGGKVLTEKGMPLAGKTVDACTGCHSQATTDMVFSKLR